VIILKNLDAGFHSARHSKFAVQFLKRIAVSNLADEFAKIIKHFGF